MEGERAAENRGGRVGVGVRGVIAGCVCGAADFLVGEGVMSYVWLWEVGREERTGWPCAEQEVSCGPQSTGVLGFGGDSWSSCGRKRAWDAGNEDN